MFQHVHLNVYTLTSQFKRRRLSAIQSVSVRFHHGKVDVLFRDICLFVPQKKPSLLCSSFSSVHLHSLSPHILPLFYSFPFITASLSISTHDLVPIFFCFSFVCLSYNAYFVCVCVSMGVLHRLLLRKMASIQLPSKQQF